MNTCQNKARELLPDYINKLLDPEDKAIIKAHVEHCYHCAAEMQVLRFLEEKELPDPEPWFFNALPGKVTAEVKVHQKKKRLIMIPVWAGGLLTAALALVFFLQPWTAPELQTDFSDLTVVDAVGSSYIGLEEEILSASWMDLEELEEPLAEDLVAFSDEYIAIMDLILEGEGYETMDEEAIQVFEDLVEKLIPEEVRKRVIS